MKNKKTKIYMWSNLRVKVEIFFMLSMRVMKRMRKKKNYYMMTNYYFSQFFQLHLL